MNRICWRLAGLVSRILDPAEREAVLGDFAESGDPGAQALRHLLGLVARRQAALWNDWRPWLALLTLAVPAGVLLGQGSIWFPAHLDLYFWIIRNYRDVDPRILESTGLTLRHGAVLLAVRSLLLAAWASSSGFALASLSRGAIWVNGALFSLVLIWAGRLPRTSHGEPPIVWPLLLQIVLILAPSIWGMRQALRRAATAMVQVILWTAAIATALAAQNWFWPPRRMNWQMWLLLLPKYWPLVYLIATKIRWMNFKEKHA